ncbi:hypothetical protein B0T19DRAFT_176026 [Cercophora scortea]|uniref:Uncharacterized protein n=1 Tax=Cercophora scortea TaxID=314031 RepID=A0AAE0IMF2_9PEZI|nr:hypothetical protein B0T19DRAFT_176026 [Cercophora scortea]
MSAPYGPGDLAIGTNLGEGSSSSSRPNVVPGLGLPPMTRGSAATTSRRRLSIALQARRTVTVEQIEAAGIKPDLASILASINAPAQPAKRTKLDDSTARKIFAASPNPPDHHPDEDDSLAYKNDSPEISAAAALEAKLQALLPVHTIQHFHPAEREHIFALARLRANQISESTTEWRAQRMCNAATHLAKFDLIGSLSTCTEIIVEVCKHLLPSDIVNLYSISRNFHTTISASMQSSVLAWSRAMAPDSSRLFAGPSYMRYYSNDPAGRPQDRAYHDLSYLTHDQPEETRPAISDVTVRKIPGLQWLQMVVMRETRVRDILATLARMGHRLPPATGLVLKKLWLVMDMATSAARIALLRDRKFFSNVELYLGQMFIVKLHLCFNDPVYGPESEALAQLMLGQRGLTPLWALLRRKRFTKRQEIVELRIEYDVGPSTSDLLSGEPVQGVPVNKMGVMHFEGWGAGTEHLLRPDELIALEAVRRGLDFDLYDIPDHMMWYGHVNLNTGQSLVPSLDEMYMDDFDLPAVKRVGEPLTLEDMVNTGCGNVPFEHSMWKPKHAKKARWNKLSAEEREMILNAEEAEMERDRRIPKLLEQNYMNRLELGPLIEQFGVKLDGSRIPEEEGKVPEVKEEDNESEDDDEDDDDGFMDVDSNSEAYEMPGEMRVIPAGRNLKIREQPEEPQSVKDLYPEFFEDMSEFEAELEADREREQRERRERGDFSDSDDDAMSYDDNEDPFRDASPLSGSAASSFNHNNDIAMRSPSPPAPPAPLVLPPHFATPLDQALLAEADEWDDADEDCNASFEFDWDGYIDMIIRGDSNYPNADRRTRELRMHFRQW